jgi:hypothetical protein
MAVRADTQAYLSVQTERRNTSNSSISEHQQSEQRMPEVSGDILDRSETGSARDAVLIGEAYGGLTAQSTSGASSSQRLHAVKTSQL